MYLNLVQIAESFGVSERVVEGWVKREGLPHAIDRGRLLFDRAQVAQWAATRGLAAQAGFLAAESPALPASARLGSLLRAGGIWRDVDPADVPALFARVATSLPGATPAVGAMLSQRLLAKGGVSLAPVGGGFALPHPSARITLGRDSGAVALILLRSAIDPAELKVDDVPVTRLLFFVAPSPRVHLDLIGRLCRLLIGGSLRDALARGASDDEVFQVVDSADAASSAPSRPEARR